MSRSILGLILGRYLRVLQFLPVFFPASWKPGTGNNVENKGCVSAAQRQLCEPATRRRLPEPRLARELTRRAKVQPGMVWTSQHRTGPRLTKTTRHREPAAKGPRSSRAPESLSQLRVNTARFRVLSSLLLLSTFFLPPAPNLSGDWLLVFGPPDSRCRVLISTHRPTSICDSKQKADIQWDIMQP